MDDTGICGRDKEIGDIRKFISTHTSGILYLAGPPGTGKSMTVEMVVNGMKDIPKLYLNCFKAQTSKAILNTICCAVGLEKFARQNESEIVARLTKKFTSRTSQRHILVLDEMDQLPKSKNVDLVRTIFSWPSQPNSKLILIGIANTANLTSGHQVVSSLIGLDNKITRIVYKPYTSKAIKSILLWYLANDENFEDANVDPKVLDMIALKCAQENGDIRSALTSFKSAIEDTVKHVIEKREASQYPTPPSTPPSSPCKEKTNLLSLTNTIRKKLQYPEFEDNAFPFPQQIILLCIQRLCSKSKVTEIESSSCERLVSKVFRQFEIASFLTDYRVMLQNLEVRGLITLKKGRIRNKIVLRVSENELLKLVRQKDMIKDLINSMT